jgi:TRAP-type C4-dicarboxylate transport system permease small subunit
MLTDIAGRAREALTHIENASSVAANVSMMLMMVLITAGTFSRYVLNNPIVGANQFVELYLMPLLVFGTAALLYREGGNINVDLIRRRFGESGDLLVDVLTHLGVLAVFVSIGYFTYGQAMSRLSRGATVSAGTGLQFPTGFSWLFVLLGVTLLCIRVAVDLVRHTLGLARNVRNRLRQRGDDSSDTGA